MENDGEVLLQEIFSQQMDEFEERSKPAASPRDDYDDDEEKRKKNESATHTQWALGGNSRFVPVGATISQLVPGVYQPFADPGQWGLELLKVASDGIYSLPDMATETVLEEVRKFWTSKDKYKKHNLLYKRGIMLWGPPGGGKTVTVKVLMNELVKKGGIVVMGNNINLTVMCLKAIRRIEAQRNLIVVFEDIDEIINYNGEAGVLSLLDGETNIDNVLNLATTNYPDKLGPRIINRPSRFDRRVYVGMPSLEARTAYLKQATNDGLSPEQLKRWGADTHEMSIAHLRELVAAVYCLDQSYEEVVGRLKMMAIPVKSEDGMRRATTGFKNPSVGGLSASAFQLG